MQISVFQIMITTTTRCIIISVFDQVSHVELLSRSILHEISQIKVLAIAKLTNSAN